MLEKVFFIWSVIAIIKVTGADKLIAQLKRNANIDDVKNVVRLNGSEMEKKMKRNASFTKGYQTGETKRSIGLEIKDKGLTAEVKPTTHYAPYLEKGTRFMRSEERRVGKEWRCRRSAERHGKKQGQAGARSRERNDHNRGR